LSVSLRDQMWFLRVCHHVSNVLYDTAMTTSTLAAPPLISSSCAIMLYHTMLQIESKITG